MPQLVDQKLTSIGFSTLRSSIASPESVLNTIAGAGPSSSAWLLHANNQKLTAISNVFTGRGRFLRALGLLRVNFTCVPRGLPLVLPQCESPSYAIQGSFGYVNELAMWSVGHFLRKSPSGRHFHNATVIRRVMFQLAKTENDGLSQF